MINDSTWSFLKSLFGEVLSWASDTILFNLTLNGVTVHLSILDFAIAYVAFDLIVGTIWFVLSRGSTDD